jgi:hypothetical protein
MLNMPSKHAKFWNWGPYWTPIEDKITKFLMVHQ